MSRNEFKDTLMTPKEKNTKNEQMKHERIWIVSGGQVGDFREELTYDK
jgi:hypothetical protein